MIWILAFLAGMPQADAMSAKHIGDIDLFRRANSESFYAGDKYRCQGMRPAVAQKAADRALGGNFRERLQRAAGVLNTRYDPSTVEEAGELVTIGFKITRARCRAVQTIVKDALRDVAELERRLGIK